MRVVEQIKNLVPKVVSSFPEIEMLYVFGSQASGLATPDSDIDVALVADESAYRNDPLVDLRIGLFFEDHLGKSVDVVVMNRVSSVMQHEVLRAGERLFERSSIRRKNYELSCFKGYTDTRHYQRRRQEGFHCG